LRPNVFYLLFLTFIGHLFIIAFFRALQCRWLHCYSYFVNWMLILLMLFAFSWHIGIKVSPIDGKIKGLWFSLRCWGGLLLNVNHEYSNKIFKISLILLAVHILINKVTAIKKNSVSFEKAFTSIIKRGKADRMHFLTIPSLKID